MTSDPRYRGLLIGNADFARDPHALPALRGPLVDIEILRLALTDDQVGLFSPDNVLPLPDKGVQELREELDTFFATARREEILLLYYSGHGRLDEHGRLYLCTADTLHDRLRATALSATEINNMIDGSAATTTIIVLDCCHSGAFKTGADLATPVAGHGRYVLASNRSTQLARDAEADGLPSPFTEILVHGLRHADATDHLTVGELYRQVHHWLTDDTPQPPQLSFAGEGDAVIARRTKKRRRVHAQHRANPALPAPRQREKKEKVPASGTAAERAASFEESWTGDEDPRKFCKPKNNVFSWIMGGIGLLMLILTMGHWGGASDTTRGRVIEYSLGALATLWGAHESYPLWPPRRLRKSIRARTLRLDRDGITTTDSSGIQRIPWDVITGAAVRYADTTLNASKDLQVLPLALHLQIRRRVPTILYRPAGWPENARLPDACRGPWAPSENDWVPVCLLGPLPDPRKIDLKNAIAANSAHTLIREHELSEKGW